MASLDRTLAHGLIVAGFTVGVVVRAFIAHRRTSSRGRPLHFEWSSALLWAVLVVTPLLASVTDVLAFADYRFSRLVAVVGIVLLAVSGWLYWRAHHDRARCAPRVEPWVAHGAYARVRHPIDAALWLWLFAQALLIANWIAGPVPLMAFIALHGLRVRREETWMLARFGDAYRDYLARTDRLVPGVW